VRPQGRPHPGLLPGGEDGNVQADLAVKRDLRVDVSLEKRESPETRLACPSGGMGGGGGRAGEATQRWT
jgi:hypothetical protein